MRRITTYQLLIISDNGITVSLAIDTRQAIIKMESPKIEFYVALISSN